MNCLPLVLYLILLLDSVLSSLPAPVNLSVSSVNFHYVLRWDPGPGTTPGTQYKIFRVKGKERQKRRPKTTNTSVELKLKRPRETYILIVQAFHKQTSSPESSSVSFTPFKDTVIGRPELSLAGCGNCIQINVSLPEADLSSKIPDNDIHAFYSPQYRVLWKKRGGAVERPYDTENKSFTLTSLQNDTEYCVQVHTKIDENKNTEPSAWECIFTNKTEPSRVSIALPAPVNLSVSSFNFHHVLHWDPGPGTPPGTQYKIFKVKTKTGEELSNSSTTSVRLELEDPWKSYYLTVRAFYNQRHSPKSSIYPFLPYEKTIIGPPTLSLAGCGNCIQINISLPEADNSSGIPNNDIHAFYSPQYRILYKKHEKEWERPTIIFSSNRSHTLTNLEMGVEYCVQVEPKATVNRNFQPSAWKCTVTSDVEPSRGPVILVTVSTLLICVGFALMATMFCLYYTGFICKLKETLPTTLIVALMSQGYTLTPERTFLDQISISPSMEKQRKYNKPATQQPAARGTNSEEEEEDEEEEEGENVYMDRAAELSSDENSCRDVDMSGNRTLAAAGDSGSLIAKVPEVEVRHEELDEDEAKAEEAEVSFISEGSQTVVQRHVTDEEREEEKEEVEEVCETSGNVNLFSVTLAALAACEEEEEEHTRDSLTDFLKLCDLEPLLPTDAGRTLSRTDSQAESHDRTAVAVTLPAQEDFTEAGYEGQRADTLSGCLKSCDGETQDEETEDEEEDDDEFSGYMRHT